MKSRDGNSGEFKMATASQLLDAISRGDLELTKQILEEGADPNEVLPVGGVAPMHIAAGLSGEATKLLLKYSGNPNVRSVEGTTPMHVACMWGKRDALIALLQSGGDPFIKDQDGETAFGSASKFKQENCLETMKLHMSEDLSSGSSTLTQLLTKNNFYMDVTSPDHPYIDEKGRRSYIMNSEDSFVTCTSHSPNGDSNHLQRNLSLNQNRNSLERNPAQTYSEQKVVSQKKEDLRPVYEVFMNLDNNLPTHSSIPSNQVNLSDLMTSDESFCPQNEDKFLSKFSAMDIKSPNQRKTFTPHKAMPSSLPTNLSDLMTSDESFVPPVKVNFVQSLNNLALNSPSKTEFVKQWHQQNFPASSLELSENSFDPDETELYDVYEDPDKTLPYSIDTLSIGESTIHYWEDPTTGNKLIEKHVPSSFYGSSGRPSLNTSICTLSTIDSEKTDLYDWKCYSLSKDDTCIDNKLSNKEIREKLQSLGDNPGPITPSTRQTYLTRLKNFTTNAKYGQLGITKKLPDYPCVLQTAVDGKFDLQGLRELEDDLIKAFNDKTLSTTWREGTVKSSFNYLLLDPRITQDLPNRADSLGELETFQVFVGSIFYIGKGKRSRPYCHLFEALNHMKCKQSKAGNKVQHILDIWNDGQGVVSLHCFQSVIPVEAYTREACMVDAIGLSRLTNMKRGDVYGPANSWTMKDRQRFGVFLLKKSLQIFLGEGERQISPADIKK